VEITIEDSGPGIPTEDKERLFLPYFSTKTSGTGLGLAIVNRIIAEHHGSIRVEENFPTGNEIHHRIARRPHPGCQSGRGVGIRSSGHRVIE
jgi:signal transduction histidine kinase